MMKKQIFFIIVLSVILSCKDTNQNQTSKQDTEEWMPLFNGKDFRFVSLFVD